MSALSLTIARSGKTDLRISLRPSTKLFSRRQSSKLCTNFYTVIPSTAKMATTKSETADRSERSSPEASPISSLESDSLEDTKPTPSSSEAKESLQFPTIKLTAHKGDIFAAPNNTLLIHACNTQGSWGAGIAAAFRERYPKAYKAYRSYCLDTHDPRSSPVPTGTCLLIPPSETKPGAPKHWVGCLFTSAKYGKARDKPDVILANTGPAMRECLQKVKERGGVDEVRMCKINSARFGVPWERTVNVLEGIELEEGWMGSVEIWSID